MIAAEPAAVYRALADADALMEWLPPGGMTGRALEYDFREGGRYRIALTHDASAHPDAGKSHGRTDVSTGRFVSLAPGAHVVQTVTFESSDPAFAGEMLMTWTFEPAPDGTRVTITAEHVPPGISAADHDAGLRATLANLARYLA